MIHESDIEAGIGDARSLVAMCSENGVVRTGRILVAVAAAWRAVARVSGVTDSRVGIAIERLLELFPADGGPVNQAAMANVLEGVPGPRMAHERMTMFCARCFADDRGGSWGEGVANGHCFNCGAGSAVSVPIWAVDSIREQASWVGRRYYPSAEDKALGAELRYLRMAMPTPDGRVVERPYRETHMGEQAPADEWSVKQMESGGWHSTTVRASTAEEALRAAAAVLPYPVPESRG